MTESAAVQLDELKPHLQAIIDEARRAGLEACRAVHYEAKASAEKTKLASAEGSPDCGGLHVLAAVAFDISSEKALVGDPGWLDWFLEGVSMSTAADACEAAHA